MIVIHPNLVSGHAPDCTHKMNDEPSTLYREYFIPVNAKNIIKYKPLLFLSYLSLRLYHSFSLYPSSRRFSRQVIHVLYTFVVEMCNFVMSLGQQCNRNKKSTYSCFCTASYRGQKHFPGFSARFSADFCFLFPLYFRSIFWELSGIV